jgi:hypothetical protein
MADFAVWRTACEETLGSVPGQTLGAYHSNRAETHQLAPESSLLYELLLKLAEVGFTGTVTELFARLNTMVPETMRRSVSLAKSTNALSNSVRRLANNLRASGIDIQFSRADIRGRSVISCPLPNPEKDLQ